VQWIDVGEYKATRPDAIVMDHPHETLQVGVQGCSPLMMRFRAQQSVQVQPDVARFGGDQLSRVMCECIQLILRQMQWLHTAVLLTDSCESTSSEGHRSFITQM
jgi:hypothetical protein